MSKILPDNRFVWTVAVLVVIAIVIFSWFRRSKQAPPPPLPLAISRTIRDKKQSQSIESQNSDELAAIKEHKLQEVDRQFLIGQGLHDPTNDLVKDLMKHNELIPCEGSVGGTPGFNSPNRIDVLSKDHVIAGYDDGHVEGTVELTFIVSRGTISWTVVHSECGN
jgi:hypothetical protein